MVWESDEHKSIIVDGRWLMRNCQRELLIALPQKKKEGVVSNDFV